MYGVTPPPIKKDCVYAYSACCIGYRGFTFLTHGGHRYGSLLPARRYASAGTSYGLVSVTLYVSVSVTSRCSVEKAE